MYLKRQGQKYVAMHTIPKTLRPYFLNRPRFKKTTGETELSRAKAVAAGFAVNWYSRTRKPSLCFWRQCFMPQTSFSLDL